MNQRQMRFVEAYARLKNARAAACEAGYSPRCASVIASRLLRVPEVAAALAAAGVALVVTPHGAAPGTQIRPALNFRQERFVAHYLILGNAAEAARRAGYSPRSAGAAVERLMKNPRVAAAIAAAKAARAERLRIDAEHVLGENARLAFADLGMIIEWGPQGATLKPSVELAPEDRAAVAEIIVETGKNGPRLRVKLFNKQRALDALGKHLGLYGKGVRPPAPPLIDGKEPRQALRDRLLRLVAADKRAEEEKNAAAAAAEKEEAPATESREIAEGTAASDSVPDAARAITPERR